MHCVVKATSWLSLVFFVELGLAESTLNSRSPSASGSQLASRVLEEIVKTEGGYSIAYPLQQIEGVTFSRMIADFEAGDIDVIWTQTNREYENKYRAIYYPIFKGLYGVRIPLVANNNRDMFFGVDSMLAFQSYTAGNVRHWADTQLLKDNGIAVVPVSKQKNLYPMLEGGRFDYFARGVHQIWGEIDEYSELNLVADEHILIYYPAPVYFFVRKDNDALYQYLNTGMQKLIESGRHNELFYEDEVIFSSIAKAKLANRQTIELRNPNLSGQTPLDQTELWFNPANPR